MPSFSLFKLYSEARCLGAPSGHHDRTRCAKQCILCKLSKQWEMPTDHCHLISSARKSYSRLEGVPPGQCIVWCSKRVSTQAISWRLKTGTFQPKESTMRENTGPAGWGLGVRQHLTPCKSTSYEISSTYSKMNNNNNYYYYYFNWVVTRWQWLFYMYTKHEIGY